MASVTSSPTRTVSAIRKSRDSPYSVPPPPPSTLPTRGRASNQVFRKAIRAFVTYAESHVPEEYSITGLLTEFHLQKRRMYDVTNVFAVVGCCEKTSGDLLRWIGLSQIPFRLRQLQLDVGADTAQATLDDIIGSSDMVSISALTMRFLLCFLVLRLKTMDIRQISRYLARRTGRRKSTLCKLYQVAHILEAAAICGRTETPGMVSLVDQFFAPVEITDLPQGPGNPYAIDALLNHPRPPDDTVIAKRRADFFAEVARPLFEPEEDDDD